MRIQRVNIDSEILGIGTDLKGQFFSEESFISSLFQQETLMDGICLCQRKAFSGAPCVVEDKRRN